MYKISIAHPVFESDVLIVRSECHHTADVSRNELSKQTKNLKQ